VYKDNTAIFEWFSMYEVLSQYARSISAYTENKLKEYERLRRMRRKYFAAHGEYADIK
jgi:hypothetical protein